MLVLLPPSEGKARGGSARRQRWVPDAGSFGASLGHRRAALASALVDLDGGSEKLLGVRGDHLDRAQSANMSLVGSPTLPAWQRYTGVVWDHLDPASLPASALRQIVVVSGLLGLVRGDDPVPDYRLKMSASIAPFGKLASWWRDTLSQELARTARRRVVVDLLAQEHRSALALGAHNNIDNIDIITITLVESSGKPGGHGAKAAKGELARALLVDGLGVLDAWNHAQFDLVVTRNQPR